MTVSRVGRKTCRGNGGAEASQLTLGYQRDTKHSGSNRDRQVSLEKDTRLPSRLRSARTMGMSLTASTETGLDIIPSLFLSFVRNDAIRMSRTLERPPCYHVIMGALGCCAIG